MEETAKISKVKDPLGRPRGFGSINPHRLTNAEAQRRWRTKNGGRGINFYCHPEAAASLLYLKKQWGFRSSQETVEAALRFLAIETRKGLKRLVLTID